MPLRPCQKTSSRLRALQGQGILVHIFRGYVVPYWQDYPLVLHEFASEDRVVLRL